jgi:hypothetical protein
MIPPIEQETGRQSLLDALEQSRSFKRNPVRWSIFYGSAVATGTMFVILCALSAWSISIGTQITGVVHQSTQILSDVDKMLPKIEESIRLLETICEHDNFTKHYGNVCENYTWHS